MEKGKPTQFHCDWCEKDVIGWLVKLIQDFIKDRSEGHYHCPNCPTRETRIITNIQKEAFS